MISVTELRSGTAFEDRGEYFLVLSYEHIKMGRGSGTVKVKVKSLNTGSTIEKSFITGAKVADVNLARKKAQYLYRDDQGYHFMDTISYDQFNLADRLTGEYGPYLKEGIEIILFAVEDKPLYIEIPKILEYKVFQTGGGGRGHTGRGGPHDGGLEKGQGVKVRPFL